MKRCADAGVPLCRQAEDCVEAACEGHLCQGEEQGGEVGVHIPPEEGGEAGQRVQEKYTSLGEETQVIF